MKNILFLLALSSVIIACGDNNLSFEERLDADFITIQEHLDANGLNATFDEDRLIYADIEVEGSGASPSLENIVEVRYKGYFLDGTVFDETLGDATVRFLLNRVIQGWQAAVPLLKRGGKGTFYIPSGLAYGEGGNAGISSNTILVFDIELVDFDRPYEEQLAIDLPIIQAHIDSNMINAVFDDEQDLYHEITEEGGGNSPTVDNTVTVKYRGYFLDGEVFDQTTGDQTISFPLSGVIEGWQRAVPLLKVGGKGTFYLPSGLAYGFVGNASIPSNANLVFDIELISFE